MKRHSRITRVFISTAVLLLISLAASCADRDAPSGDTVRELLDSYYALKQYKVVSLEVGQIEGAPIAQKAYGKKRPYYVTVKKIILEANGQTQTLQGGIVVIREKKGAPGEWEIERVPPELAL